VISPTQAKKGLLLQHSGADMDMSALRIACRLAGLLRLDWDHLHRKGYGKAFECNAEQGVEESRFGCPVAYAAMQA
jgi:hypothetical protein